MVISPVISTSMTRSYEDNAGLPDFTDAASAGCVVESKIYSNLRQTHLFNRSKSDGKHLSL